MMTSKPEDRLRKNGVKTRKYYKWLRWSMKKRIIIFTCITILSITTIYFACRTYYLNEAVNEYYNSIPIEVEESIEVIE